MRRQKSVSQEWQLLQTLIDNLPNGIFLKDREGRFLPLVEIDLLPSHVRQGEIVFAPWRGCIPG